MIQLLKKNKITASLLVVSAAIVFSSCNKEPEQFASPVTPPQATTPTLATLLDDPAFSILKAAAKKGGVLPLLSAPTLRFTLFAPNDAAFTVSGISAAVIDALDSATVKAIVSYHIIPQEIKAADIPTSFPNLPYPSIFNPAPTLNALVRLDNFPSRRATGAWLNNIPITGTDIPAVNGVMHTVAAVVAPPNAYLWNAIDADPDYTLLKAALQRADSGVTTIAQGSLIAATQSIGANLTIFAPNNDAFKGLINYVSGGAVPLNAPDAVFIGFIGTNLPVQTAKGIAAYHILGKRAFSVNLPTTATNIPTLLNGAIAAHPGLSIQVAFTGPFVTSGTVKGVGNPTASNITVLDKHYLNGVIHKIDQVLLPQ